MARRVSIKDVAQRAGVSWKTVSNVVNERPVVRPGTRATVLAAIEELGYVPNHVGRELRGGPTRTIALVVPELQNPYFARLAERMQAAARERGYTVSVEVSLHSAETERAHVRGRTARPVDAVVISPSALDPADLLDRASGPPVVLLGETLPGAAGVVHVAIDNVASAADVVRHLVAGGHRRLLFLGAEDAVRSTGTDRLAGFRAATCFAELPQDPTLVRGVGDWTREAGRDAVLGALEDGAEFDAVVAGNDLLAVGALAALHARGLDVPGDVAVVGWDDTVEVAWTRPALTSIAPDLDALIAAALDAAIAGAEQNGTEQSSAEQSSAEPAGARSSAGATGRIAEAVIAHRLVERESTRAVPSA
ncbi:LacI family DNA-binding transcriptional regulator [Brachybacterium fresconis]|uniref:DNA-binding LacI/PurR family transcriptional regulator n=1 Tax=Brachybacterium fresconis TaxID=173363 RepID=A0ABS4YP39_9MICO|nr:LacI family DNA-binding transcriptional regulator [Brachybacterium fresconis]MBP2410543.1 DNA-binding LacI/PurR family transcriptional regulator [Brachybacterium fresconis]